MVRYTTPYHPSIRGKGFIGIGPYKYGKKEKAALIWNNILDRSYSEATHKR